MTVPTAKEMQDDIYNELVAAGYSKEDAWTSAYASEYSDEDLTFEGQEDIKVPTILW